MTWLMVLLGLVGTWLNVEKNPLCFVLWMLSNTYLAIHNLAIREYAQAALFGVYLGFAVMGYRRWTRG